MDLHAWITQQVDAVERLIDENEWPPSQEAGVRLRCEADRRILARHALDPDRAKDPVDATMCKGCGTYGDCDWPETENINDCPELLDLAHAHGLTDGILAGLDRPQTPERKPYPGGFAGMLRDAFDDALKHTFAQRTAMTEVPATFRGPRWRQSS